MAIAPKPSISLPVLSLPMAVSQAESVSSSVLRKAGPFLTMSSVSLLPSPSNRKESVSVPGVNLKWLAMCTTGLRLADCRSVFVVKAALRWISPGMTPRSPFLTMPFSSPITEGRAEKASLTLSLTPRAATFQVGLAGRAILSLLTSAYMTVR